MCVVFVGLQLHMYKHNKNLSYIDCEKFVIYGQSNRGWITKCGMHTYLTWGKILV